MRLLKLQKTLLFIPFANWLIFFIFGINQIINFFSGRLPVLKATLVYAVTMISIFVSERLITTGVNFLFEGGIVYPLLIKAYLIGLAMGAICIFAGIKIGKLIGE